MIETTGVVVSVHGGLAEVESHSRSACGGCSADGACGTFLLSRYLGRKPALLTVFNGVGAGPGDSVVIALPESALLEAAFAAYLVPLLAMIGASIGGAYIGAIVAPAHVQGVSVVAGLGGLSVALVWLARYGRVRTSDARYRPRILRRIGCAGAGRTPEQPAIGLAGARRADGT